MPKTQPTKPSRPPSWRAALSVMLSTLRRPLTPTPTTPEWIPVPATSVSRQQQTPMTPPRSSIGTTPRFVGSSAPAVADAGRIRGTEPAPRDLRGINGPTIFTDPGTVALIKRTLPYGPGGGVLRGIRTTLPQGGPTGACAP